MMKPPGSPDRRRRGNTLSQNGYKVPMLQGLIRRAVRGSFERGAEDGDAETGTVAGGCLSLFAHQDDVVTPSIVAVPLRTVSPTQPSFIA